MCDTLEINNIESLINDNSGQNVAIRCNTVEEMNNLVSFLNSYCSGKRSGFLDDSMPPQLYDMWKDSNKEVYAYNDSISWYIDHKYKEINYSEIRHLIPDFSTEKSDKDIDFLYGGE